MVPSGEFWRTASAGGLRLGDGQRGRHHVAERIAVGEDERSRGAARPGLLAPLGGQDVHAVRLLPALGKFYCVGHSYLLLPLAMRCCITCQPRLLFLVSTTLSYICTWDQRNSNLHCNLWLHYVFWYSFSR